MRDSNLKTRVFKYGRGNRVILPKVSQVMLAMSDQANQALIGGMTFLNDQATLTRASVAYDPYNRASVASGARRRRPFNIAGRVYNLDLVESAITNLSRHSQDLGNVATWTATDTTVTSGAAAAPDGTMTMDLVTDGATTASSLTQTIATITAGQAVVASRYFKAGVPAFVCMRIADAAGSLNAWFNLSTGAALSTTQDGTATQKASGILEEPAGSGIYRCWVSGKLDAATTTCTHSTRTSAGNLSADSVDGGTYYCGWSGFEQVGAGPTTPHPTSYRVTTGTVATRSADALSAPYVLGQTGTLLAVVVPAYWGPDQNGNTAYELFDTDGTSTRIARASASTLQVRTTDAGGAQGPTFTQTAFAKGTMAHVAMTWDATAVLGYTNGVLGGTDSTITAPYTRNNTAVYIGAGTAAGAFTTQGWVGLFASRQPMPAASLLSLYTSAHLGS